MDNFPQIIPVTYHIISGTLGTTMDVLVVTSLASKNDIIDGWIT